MGHKATVIGLDGATFKVLLPLVQQGKLPTLKGLLENGAWGELESTIHPLSPQAWASFMTGTNPGKHGIFEFVEHKPQSYELRYLNGGFVRGRKIWEILSSVGKRVCVINVPFTFPPQKVNGYLIAGLDSPGPHSSFCHPPGLLQELTSRFGPYQLRTHPYGAEPRTYLKRILSHFEYTLEVAKYLKAKEPWDFFMVVFEATDLVQHLYWHYAFPEQFGILPNSDPSLAAALRSVYTRIDEGLSQLLRFCQAEETVVVMSDHGFSPCRKIIFMDSWLRQHGYLSYHARNKFSYTATRILHQGFQRFLPHTLKEWVHSLSGDLKDRVRSHLTFSSVDWSKTRAFSLGIDSTNIFINVKGRFPNGIVEPGKEYEDVRTEIAQGLGDLADPDTGERVLQKAFKREELYHGDCLRKAPDLLITWKGFEYNTRRSYDREGDALFGSSLEFSDVTRHSSLQKSGTHHLQGIFISKGPAIRPVGRFERARIIDLAPTILYLLGTKVPEGLDGNVLTTVLEKGFLDRHPIEREAADLGEVVSGTDYSEEDEALVAERLKGLGYVD